MLRALPLLLALSLLGTLVAVASPASALAAECEFTGPPVGGIVGRTYQYAANVADAACDETFAYAFDVCVFVLGPAKVCYLA